MLKVHFSQIILILWILNNECFTEEPGDCVVSEWSGWGSCSHKCSVGGTKTRTRTIIKPLTNLFAKPCPPDLSQSAKCGVRNNGCQQFCDENDGKCGCKNGLKLNDDNKTCSDYDECLVNFGRGPCNQKCVNTFGSYYCNCNPSYYLAADKHNCHFNESAYPCDFETHEYDKNNNCNCKDENLQGLKCNQDRNICKTSQCTKDEICLKFIHLKDRCTSKDFIVPILLPLPYENYVQGDFKYLVEMYITNILEGIKPKEPLFSTSGQNMYKKNDKTHFFYGETVKAFKSKSFTFIQLIVLDAKNFSPVEKDLACSKLAGSDVHCLTVKQCNILKSDGKECPFVYSSLQTTKEEKPSSKTWVIVIVCVLIMIVILLVIFLFLKRRRGWKVLRINFNRRNEEVTCQNETPLLRTNEPPPPYTPGDGDNLQHIEHFDASVFTGEPSKQDSDKHIYEAVNKVASKLPEYSEYEAMDGSDKKDLFVDLSGDAGKSRYVPFSTGLDGQSTTSNAGPSMNPTQEHYATRVSNRPLTETDDNGIYEDIVL